MIKDGPTPSKSLFDFVQLAQAKIAGLEQPIITPDHRPAFTWYTIKFIYIKM